MSQAESLADTGFKQRYLVEIQGLVDGGSDKFIKGWARNVHAREERLKVHLRIGEVTVTTELADQERMDLAKNNVGDGKYAFRIELKPEWAQRYAELSVVAQASDGTEATLPMRIRRPDIDPSGNIQRTLEATSLMHRQILEEVRMAGRRAEAIDASRDEAVRSLSNQLETLTIWLTRIDERLAAMPSTPSVPAKRRDGWQYVLVVVLLAVLSAAGLGTFLLAR